MGSRSISMCRMVPEESKHLASGVQAALKESTGGIQLQAIGYHQRIKKHLAGEMPGLFYNELIRTFD